MRIENETINWISAKMFTHISVSLSVELNEYAIFAGLPNLQADNLYKMPHAQRAESKK